MAGESTARKGAETTSQDGSFTLLLFASASSYAGDIETLTLSAPMSLRDVFATLEQKFPGFEKKVLRSAAVTVNLEYVDFDLDGEEGEGLDIEIKKGDEVGIIPPVSSG
ncbi:molybdopterin synthase-like protein small subunit CnxG [Exophiala viscosa]|uniref:Molybdopterin synthase-like protein small subunit CnxG n=1 Tax=Exophiala viscosa TaxID=2486360 RepID=A0AAN6I9U1_9EURO|nr:molybdopterin synthase-like protein small subunit CnxG [Exophiala viscosa]KAI1621003.1 molybdopterin synthase-like protein small subunit CnxG [Exophiala viscosa]